MITDRLAGSRTMRPRLTAGGGGAVALPGPTHWGHGHGRADSAWSSFMVRL